MSQRRFLVTRYAEPVNNGKVRVSEVMNRDTGMVYRIWSRPSAYFRIENVTARRPIKPEGELGCAIVNALHDHADTHGDQPYNRAK